MHTPAELMPAFRLVYVCDEFPGVTPHFGGIGVAFQAEAEWFAGAGCDVHVIVQHPRVISGSGEERGVVVHSVPSSRVPKVAAILDRFSLARSVAKLMGGAKGVVVAADYAALLVSKPFPQPLVIQLHGSSTVNALQRNESPRRLVRALERRELRLASGVRAVSDFTAATTFRALGVAKKKTVVVPNSVDGDLFRPGDETPTPGRILFVGKLNTIKGARVLAEIVGPVLDAVSEAHFVIVGQDTTEGGRSVLEDMKRVIPEGSGERVRFAGRLSRQEVADIYRSSAVVVMPSLSEACPMVALESMASGRPVVASRRAAIPEFVVDGVTGILADPSRPRDFAGALVRILREPALARAMGEAARGQALARYAREPVMHRLRAFYVSLINGVRPSSVTAPEARVEDHTRTVSPGIF